jgi:hypothetical protein
MKILGKNKSHKRTRCAKKEEERIKHYKMAGTAITSLLMDSILQSKHKLD